ncbi:MAG: PAS domain S-box protein [Deltaproteobacteria bacterium]|nr:PAS domain S-box protein [Deltaproteobacteria bacterium]
MDSPSNTPKAKKKTTRQTLEKRIRQLEKECAHLRHENRLITSLLNATEESAILGHPSNAMVLACNRKAAERVGRTVDELVGLSMFDYLPRDLARARKRQGDQAVQSRKPIHFQDTRAGRTYDNTITPVFDDQGRVWALAIYARDITDLLHLSETLQESERRFRILAEQCPNMIFINAGRRILYANPRCEEIMGYERQAFYAPDFDFRALIAPESRELVEKHLKAHLKGRDVNPYECVLLTKDGRRLHVILSTKLVDFGGQQAILGIMTDVTAYRQAQSALKESEKRYRKLINLCPDPVVVLQDHNYRLVNMAFTETFGYTLQDIRKGLSFYNLVQPRDKRAVRKRYQNRLAGKPVSRTFRIDLVAKDGTIIPCETSAALIRHEGRPADLVIIRDISERLQAQEALEKKEAELHAKAESLEQVNTALRVLLKERQRDKADLENRVLSNLTDLVLPYLERLRNTGLNQEQLSFLDILESNLNEIISPFSQKLSSKYLGLTPTEIQVAGLIKAGKTTKEIAALMNLSTKTIEFHRDKIRKKFGIKNTGVNLRTHLLFM